MSQIVFTPSSLLDLLSQIDELSDYDIDVSEVGDEQVEITIGESTYSINSQDAYDVAVDDETVEDVESINDEGYEELGVDTLEDIEGGLIKTAVKALLLRGLIKLSSKLID